MTKKEMDLRSELERLQKAYAAETKAEERLLLEQKARITAAELSDLTGTPQEWNQQLEQKPDSKPQNRAVNGDLVRVRAVRHVAESIGGNLRRFAPGQDFIVPKDRAKALGKLVEVVK